MNITTLVRSATCFVSGNASFCLPPFLRLPSRTSRMLPMHSNGGPFEEVKQYVLSKFWSIWFLKGGQEHWTPTFKADLPGPQISGLPPPNRVWSVKVPTTPCHAMEYHVIAENTSPYRVWTVKATVVETCLLHRSPDSIVGNMLGSILCRLTTSVTRIAAQTTQTMRKEHYNHVSSFEG